MKREVLRTRRKEALGSKGTEDVGMEGEGEGEAPNVSSLSLFCTIDKVVKKLTRSRYSELKRKMVR